MSLKHSTKSAKKTNIVDNDFEQQPEKESWFANGLHRFIIVFSVIWFGIVAVYINNFFGWDQFFSMVPNEFTGFMASLTLPLAILWVIMAYIDRGNSFKNETKMLRDSLSQVIFPDSDGSNASKMIANAIKTQVSELKEATRDACAQSDIIKRDLSERVAEMKSLTEALDKYSSQTLVELNNEINKLTENFNQVAKNASATTADFRVNTLQMREDSEKMVNILTPMVNEMVTAAERVKEVVNVNNENIAKAQEQLNKYSDSSQIAIGRMIETWTEKGDNLQKTFLRTSENCEELFRRLDSGISHIENSIKEQKLVVETQSNIIDKNSAYLDNKLGEYGKLISLEVEAMVERSGTLEKNIQTHLRTMRDVSTQVSDIFVHLGNNVVEKRKLFETESQKIVNNLNISTEKFSTEIKRLQDFYSHTQNKSGEFNKLFQNVSENLNSIEKGLTENVENFSNKTLNIFTDFNEINKKVAENINKLSDNAANLTEQSKNNANLLITQDEYISKAMNGLKQIINNISSLNKNLHENSDDMGETLQKYENKMAELAKNIDNHLQTLHDGYAKTEKQIDKFNQKLKTASMDVFMRDSSTIISELESLSIDINAIFNKAGKDNELWKKYYEGDHGAFVRYLSKNMTKKQIISIQEDYQNKSDFRILVDKYMDDFEKLVASARENERAGTLLALISGSDIGKIYFILAKVLGKIN